MERLTGSILNDLITISSAAPDGLTDPNLRLKEVLCWRTAFFLRTAVDVLDNGTVTESIVDIFVTLVDQSSPYCVASDEMGIGKSNLLSLTICHANGLLTSWHIFNINRHA
jgi:hypothetical protein